MTGPELAGGSAAGWGIGDPQTVEGLLFAAAGLAGLPPCANAGGTATAARSAAQASVRANCFCIKGFRNTLVYLDSDAGDRNPAGIRAGSGFQWVQAVQKVLLNLVNHLITRGAGRPRARQPDGKRAA